MFRVRLSSSFFIRISLGAALFILTILPILFVLYRSILPAGVPTLSFYREAYRQSINFRAMKNTLIISTATVAFCAMIAIPSAWLLARTDLPGRRRFRSLLLLPYIIPPYLGAIAWINLANPSVGWLNRMAGWQVFNVYSIWGIVWIEGLFYYTFIYLNCLAAMDNTDASLEEAARVSGAGPLRVLWTITLPLIRPAIISGAFLVFAATAASFGVPYLIGKAARIPIFTIQIYNYARGGDIEGQYTASALSALLLVIVLLASTVAQRFSSVGRITSLSGKASRRSLVQLGRWRWPAFLFIFLILFFTCILPLASVVLTSFMKVVGQFDFKNFTFEKYSYVLFKYPSTASGFLNSFLLAFGAATLSVVIGTALAYGKGHPRIGAGAFQDMCVNLPYATPGTILALGLILLWTRPIPLTDTLWILLLAYFAKYFSFAVKSLTTNVQQIDVSLEDAARVSGAGFFTAFRTIWLPLLRPAILASWFLVFMPAFSELTMSVLLVGPGTETIGTVLFKLQEYADPPSANVLAVLVLVLILSAYSLAIWLSPKSKSISAN